MIRARTGFTSGCVLATLLAAAGLADDKAAEAVLKGQGLRRAGSLFVLPAEAEVSKKLRTLQAQRRELAVAASQERAAEKGAGDAKKMIAILTRQRLQLREQMRFAATVEQRNAIVDALNDLGDRINLLQTGQGDSQALRDFTAALSRKRALYMQGLLDARNLADETTRSYADIAADAEVQAALSALNATRKEKLVLGPSRTFRADLKTLEALERTVQTETVRLREDGGTFEVDVVFNNKVTKSMIFDTGASLVTLPADFAAEIGVKVSDDLPTVRLQVADGRIREGKLVRLGSVRVGKSTAENVEAAVMADGTEAGVPPLLGGSFLKHFTYKLNPATGELTLSKVGGASTSASRSTTPRKVSGARP